MDSHIIVATGHWNGADRTLYWAAVLPTLKGWSSSPDQAIVFTDSKEADEDLVDARRLMVNPHLEVALRSHP